MLKKKRKVEPNRQCTGERNYVLVKDPTNGKSEILYLSSRPLQLLHECWKLVFIALIAWLKSGLEQWAKAVWLQQETFTCHCEQQNVFCKPGKSTDPVHVVEEYVKTQKSISRAGCKPLNMMNLLSGFVMFPGGTSSDMWPTASYFESYDDNVITATSLGTSYS